MAAQDNDPFKAYSRANHTVAKTRQIVMLYDGMIRFMQQAKDAIEAKDVEGRYKRLLRASEIIMGLQSSLDFQNGGDAARVLYDFYSHIDARIISIHRSNSTDTCEEVIAQLRDMRALWDKIDRGEAESVTIQQGGVTGGTMKANTAQTTAHGQPATAEPQAPSSVAVSA